MGGRHRQTHQKSTSCKGHPVAGQQRSTRPLLLPPASNSIVTSVLFYIKRRPKQHSITSIPLSSCTSSCILSYFLSLSLSTTNLSSARNFLFFFTLLYLSSKRGKARPAQPDSFSRASLQQLHSYQSSPYSAWQTSRSLLSSHPPPTPQFLPQLAQFDNRP